MFKAYFYLSHTSTQKKIRFGSQQNCISYECSRHTTTKEKKTSEKVAVSRNPFRTDNKRKMPTKHVGSKKERKKKFKSGYLSIH